MEGTLPRRALLVLREEGTGEFVQRSLRFTRGKVPNSIFSTDNGGLEDLVVDRTKVEPSETFTISYEGNSRESLPQPLARIEGTVTTQPRYVREFEDAKLLGDPLVVNIGWTFFNPTSIGNARRNFSTKRHPLRDVTPPKPAADKDVEFGFVMGGERNGYAHWSYEQLPKLRWYEAYCAQTGSEPELIISGTLSEWQRRSLEFLGYSTADYLQHRHPEVIDVQRLLVPPHPRRTHAGEFHLCPAAIQWLRERIRSNGPTDPEAPSRVYVSRADADRRQVANEDEVTSLLGTYDFRSVAPGQFSFEEQVRLFSNADVIVGPHGAGLTNMIYADNADVVELLNQDAGEHFFVLANECNHSYEFLQCDPIQNEEIKPRHRDITVDLADLDRALDSLLTNTT